MTVEECIENGIRVYPDNDGGLWYYGEHGKETVIEDGKRTDRQG